MAYAFIVLFIIAACSHLISEGFRFMPGRYVTKPMLMPALGMYYLFSVTTPHLFLLAALVFAWLGDIFSYDSRSAENQKIF